jgi:hypothetical protein
MIPRIRGMPILIFGRLAPSLGRAVQEGSPRIGGTIDCAEGRDWQSVGEHKGQEPTPVFVGFSAVRESAIVQVFGRLDDDGGPGANGRRPKTCTLLPIAPSLRSEPHKASWRSRRTELWHHPLGKPSQIIARALAKEQYVSDAHFLKRGKPLRDLLRCTDQRMRFGRVGVT